jgi:hypothetical protein
MLCADLMQREAMQSPSKRRSIATGSASAGFGSEAIPATLNLTSAVLRKNSFFKEPIAYPQRWLLGKF